MTILPDAAPMTVGSQRDSRESMRRKTASWSRINPSSLATSLAVDCSAACGIGCPGMGMVKECAAAFYDIVSWWIMQDVNHLKTHHAWEYLLEFVGSALRFRLPAIETVLKVKQWLTDRIGVRHFGRVDEGDVSNSPTLQAVNTIRINVSVPLTINARAT